jgi:hypothetical protein
MAGMGRAGSPAHTETMMREIGDLYNRGLGQNYENERGRQLQATGLIDNAGYQQGQMLHNLLAGRGNLEGANIANMVGTGSTMFDAIGQGQDRSLQYGLAAPSISDFRYQDPSKLIDIGASQRGDLQSELQSFIERFQTEDMAPWNRLGMTANMITGSSQPFYSQTTTSPVDSGSNFANTRHSKIGFGPTIRAAAGLTLVIRAVRQHCPGLTVKITSLCWIGFHV